jgi:hypothetical protein
LPDLKNALGFEAESPFFQEQMDHFSIALAEMNLGEFTPSVAAEAQQSEVNTAEEAAISRLRQIQDGIDFWEGRSSLDTGSDASAPG